MAERAQLNSLSDEYQSLQTELSTLVSARQKLESQQQENVGVQKEFNGLADDATIYKLVGPVLLKQDTTEAKSTVDGRLSYIEQEIKRIEGSIKGIQEKSEGKKMEILQIQSQMQQAQS
ncbi:Prefoldin subunit 6 [Fulvia fulva]|uniref:Prefoldin subunit 6 n=1 Tax=Passalora fulva TaxID=5499 RepID=A0A9Q8PJY1_PASFU|nr:Prefoldin subunit 6 [Fulvia fulva]KAK4611763.1 Prefoldin subunit 6 [Fulvia fulva]KAK4612695.1 Prefoldin subunit 6 [Fulvia fulva]UJO23853.1 Prefoldin subunit 6 [Fulvia fulva]WPV21449.1 Prefoldin subunit 6 [Fulvia fulva]WPV36055.1 Prefoldin subunit 6 [Fulvia fulva]